MRTKFTTTTRRVRGFSLIELMISMAIGLVTVAAIIWIYLGTAKTYRVQDGVARMQEGARFVFEQISNDLRMAGLTGCSYGSNANVVNGSGWYLPLIEQPISSAEKTGTSGAITEFSDALTVLRADVWNERIVSSHVPGAATFTLSAAHGFSDGALLLATDCNHVAVFQASDVPTTTTIEHATGGTPGNSVADLGDGGVPYTFNAGSRVYALNATTYFVKNNPVGVPSLYRRVPSGATAADLDEELMEGVEDLQITYGADTDATPDGAINMINVGGTDTPYVDVTQVESASVPGATSQEKWQRVVSARVTLLMRTTEDNLIPSAQSYAFNGADVTAADRRLRKVFTHVVKLRNR